MNTGIGLGLYVKNSVDAVELYKKAFGLELGYHVLNEDGSYFHSELYSGDREMLAVVEADKQYPTGHAVQLGVELSSEDEVRKAFELLSEGGTVDMAVCTLPWSDCAASVIDRFGIWWYLSVPQHHPAEDWTPNT